MISPEGTVEAEPHFCRPFGTHFLYAPIPNAEALGYSRLSLRDQGAPTNHDLGGYQCLRGGGREIDSLAFNQVSSRNDNLRWKGMKHANWPRRPGCGSIAAWLQPWGAASLRSETDAAGDTPTEPAQVPQSPA